MCNLRQRLRSKELSEGHKSEFKTRIGKIAGGDSFAAQLGRSVLGLEANLLLAVDAEWAKALLLEMLDFTSPERAESTWHGYLLIPHLPAVETLLPAYASAV